MVYDLWHDLFVLGMLVALAGFAVVEIRKLLPDETDALLGRVKKRKNSQSKDAIETTDQEHAHEQSQSTRQRA